MAKTKVYRMVNPLPTALLMLQSGMMICENFGAKLGRAIVRMGVASMNMVEANVIT